MDWFLYDNGLRHERVKTVNYFRKKALSQMFGWVLNLPLNRYRIFFSIILEFVEP